MKNYNTLKVRAILLRKNGASYGTIKKELNISKSTLSYWLKDIPIKEKYRKRFYTNQILNLSKGAQSQKERRVREVTEIIKNASKEVSKSISLESYRLFGAALYWAEGNKKNGLCVTNSDPYLILFMVKWFEKIFSLMSKNLKARLNIYPQQNELEIKKFWSQLTGIPLENFGKSFIKPLNKNYKKNTLYYGTIRIEVPRGTDMRHRIFGWIKAVLHEISSKTESTQQEWKRLEISRTINIPK
ncbi:MAG: hypothetical protein UR46_C0018G0006 [Parcubacteria group bacterium GW2011_GWA1_33_6]|uniref:Uncharacterized protein n=1 Tax=Candidatus Staskawiczbacteria bacterium RIFCSPHIGHO2_02_FULL_33_16 TaxID=1802204 RepID=A0A1G2HW44_9BACT|nr:MAG: hypothetical protein UR31_C0013G0033 [Parcubacteria group bacterium GW2011_GWA2_33_14]KKP54555.1 MAG: hypothetical protein UR46_C0018G0006 [Parcubacteria group bacterium GW2011_GWA1_33_6]OGZ66774.1 MAG: hypothetical protein A3D34_03630 [Candidatus Staskawiczbacteria bacterium RIFCSPHIGHO2_02_FULL_33_16]OGZ70882.1 MAG: hypothetical protein A2980_02545 [Candidatus Staskawiczbacteria bacterium RIFCSPLOWO2_01_FULL_33_13]